MKVYTLEIEPGDETGAHGVRHAECVNRTDGQGHCIVLTERLADRLVEEDAECWGCDGWLHEPPLTVEQTAALHALREEP